MAVDVQMKSAVSYVLVPLDGLVIGAKRTCHSVPLTLVKTMPNVSTYSWTTFVSVPKESMVKGVKLHLKGALDRLA